MQLVRQNIRLKVGELTVSYEIPDAHRLVGAARNKCAGRQAGGLRTLDNVQIVYGADVEQVRRDFDDLAIVHKLPMINGAIAVECGECARSLVECDSVNIRENSENEKALKTKAKLQLAIA